MTGSSGELGNDNRRATISAYAQIAEKLIDHPQMEISRRNTPDMAWGAQPQYGRDAPFAFGKLVEVRPTRLQSFEPEKKPGGSAGII